MTQHIELKPCQHCGKETFTDRYGDTWHEHNKMASCKTDDLKAEIKRLRELVERYEKWTAHNPLPAMEGE